jgi:hypothetical protein
LLRVTNGLSGRVRGTWAVRVEAATLAGMAGGQLAVVEDWHAAVNGGDAARAGDLCTSDVEVGGPRGSGFGRELILDWVGRAGIRMEPVRWFCGPGGAVVEQDARWLDIHTGELGEPVRLATAFVVENGRVSRVLRHPDAAGALAALGLRPVDEVGREINRM